MNYSISSPAFTFELNPDSGEFDLCLNRQPQFALHGCRALIELRQGDQRQTVLCNHLSVSQPGQDLPGPHGQIAGITAEAVPSGFGIACRLTFGLARDYPMFLWKVEIENQSSLPVNVEKITFLRVGGQESFGQVGNRDSSTTANWTIFSNGWQSWSPTGAYPDGRAMRVSRLGFLQKPMIINPGTPILRQSGYYTADFFGALADQKSKVGLVAGFLSQKQHFGSLEAILYDRPSLRLFTSDFARLDPGSVMTTDWAVITPLALEDPDPLGIYLDAVAREHGMDEKSHRPMPAGWCSWYQYYSQLTAADVAANIKSITANRSGLPLDLIQIDDGFETSVGDWFSFKSGFPDGVAALAREIKAGGFIPGLWLAPFILNPGSRFAKDHPEFILRNKRGKAINAGYGWNNLATAVDLTVPGALDAVMEPLQVAVQEWGFPYLKLDFLYAAALQGLRFDPTCTRAQTLRLGMETIRSTVGSETYLVGCGLPLGSGIGVVDAMRIGADVTGSWEPEIFHIKFPLINEPAVPSARNSIHNILTRAPLHQRWWVNDPDCLLVRPDSGLTLSEIQSLATAIGMTGGTVILSDDLTVLPPERLRMASTFLPPLGQRPEILDLLTSSAPTRLRLDQIGPHAAWTILAIFNWSDKRQPWIFKPADFHLPDNKYWLSSFWDERLYEYQPGEQLAIPEISPHGVHLVAVMPVQDMSEPQYLGSNLHFSQGHEVQFWQVGFGQLHLNLRLGHTMEGFFRLQLPSPPQTAMCNNRPILFQPAGDQIYQFRLPGTPEAEILICYQ